MRKFKDFFKKKFKVKVVHYYKEKYTIMYSYSRLFSRWTYLKQYLGKSNLTGEFYSSIHVMQLYLLKPDKAEEKAKSFKSIEDVREHHKKEREIMQQVEDKVYPYKEKIIK